MALGQLCYPNDNITGNSGHDDNDVLYIGFTGNASVAGSSANWAASSTQEFVDSIKSIGDSLVAGLQV